jgi:Restriction endonuclease NotI
MMARNISKPLLLMYLPIGVWLTTFLYPSDLFTGFPMAGRITEFFGYTPLDPAAKIFARSKTCPFVKKRCLKPTLGACSLQQTNSAPVIICPNRLYAQNHMILSDIAEQAFGAGVGLATSSQIATARKTGSITGNEVAVFGKYWGSELSIPQPRHNDEESSDGFYIDYVLARLNKSGGFDEFTAVEVQTIDTTGTYRPQSEAFFAETPFTDNSGNSPGWSTAGLNWANVSKRILPQLIYKGYVLRRERKCGKGLFFVCPSTVLDRVKRRLGTKMLEYPIAAGTITFQPYDIGDDPGIGKQRKLIKGEPFTTTVEQVAYAFVSPVNLPEMGVYEKAITAALR